MQKERLIRYEGDRPFGKDAIDVVEFAEIKSRFNNGFKSSLKYVIFCEKRDNLAGYAPQTVSGFFIANPEILVAYGDSAPNEENLNLGFFRPSWSPHYFLDSFYTGGFFAVRTELLNLVETSELKLDGTPLSDAARLFYALSRISGGFSVNKSCKTCKVGHIPYILYLEDFKKDALRYKKTAKEVFEEFLPKVRDPRVSAIILSKDHPGLVKKCVETLFTCSTGVELEIILTDNGSNEANRKITEDFCRKNRIKYIYEPCEFNFSYLCNLSAKEASGDYFLFCNDDIEFTGKDTVYELARSASLEFTGEAGLKLLYPDSDRIQHAGISNVLSGPMHKLQFYHDNVEYNFGRNSSSIDVMAVTAACVMISRDKFLEAGRFPENLKVAFNDVALGFSLHKLGYYNVCRNDLSCIHKESQTRGNDSLDVSKISRLIDERNLLYGMFPEYRGGFDPYLSPVTDKSTLDTGIVTAFATEPGEISKAAPGLSPQLLNVANSGRNDETLFLGMEYFGAESDYINGGSKDKYIVRGYAFVTGFDNCAMKKSLLFARVDGSALYEVKLFDVYRPDVARNAFGQTNVSLSGFEASFDTQTIPAGSYKVLIFLKDSCSRLVQLRDTGRRFEKTE